MDRRDRIQIGLPPLGDAVEKGLGMIGITHDRLARWLGRPCKCPERRDKWNAMQKAAEEAVSGKLTEARDYLYGLMDGEKPGDPKG